ncbi:MAG: DUF885 family protein [Caulobacteraceae bacterium]
MTKFFAGVGCLAMILSGAAAANAQTPAAGSADARFKSIYTAEWAWRQSQRGESDEDHHDIDPKLPRVDLATQQARLAYWTKVMQQLDTIREAELSPKEQLNYEVYKAQIQVDINSQAFKEYERPLNADTAFWSNIAGPARRPFKSAQQYRDFISQMNDIPRYFHEEEANMRAGLKRGFTPPKVTLEGRDSSIKSVAGAASPEAVIFFRPFEKFPDSIPAAEQAELRAQGLQAIQQSVLPAYKELLAFFDDDYVPHAQVALAADALPDGKAYYQSKILEFTTTDMTPEQIHQLGLDEVAKIHAEMLETMKASGFKGSFPEFLHFLRTDPQFYAKTPDELLKDAAWIAKEFDGVAGKYFGYLPRQRFGITPVPLDQAPFYTSGRGGPGTYLVNTYDLPSRGLYSLPALTLHESAPGHAFQMPIALEHKDLPKFRTVYISAYGEGWALYCERLGTEMGIYHTPYDTFGMLSYQAWRAARLVVDTGIHTQGWTRKQAQDYLRDNTALSDHEIETEVDRYIAWPGQALSYYLGEMAIQRSRHKAEAALGAKFNIRAFHDSVLELGSVPLPVLEHHIDAFIAHGGTGPYPDMER